MSVDRSSESDWIWAALWSEVVRYLLERPPKDIGINDEWHVLEGCRLAWDACTETGIKLLIARKSTSVFAPAMGKHDAMP